MQSSTYLKLSILCLLMGTQLAQSTSLVYNLRIRRSFIQSGPLTSETPTRHLFLTGLPIIGARTECFNSNNHEERFYGGAVLDARYRFNKNWKFGGTTAIAHENFNFTHGGIKGNRTRSGFDDIVFTSYYNFFPHQRAQLISYVLAGFPTTRKFKHTDTLNVLVGTKLFSLGSGLEGSYSFLERDKTTLAGIIQARFIHFFSRTVSPLLPCDYKIHPGNVTDLFAALHYRHGRHHLEWGYDATLYTNIRIEQPTFIKKEPFVLRNSAYTSYSYIIKARGACGTGVSCQFVKKPFTGRGWSAWVFGAIAF